MSHSYFLLNYILSEEEVKMPATQLKFWRQKKKKRKKKLKNEFSLTILTTSPAGRL